MSQDELSTKLSNRDDRGTAPLRFRVRVVEGADSGKHVELDRASQPVLVGTGEAASLRLGDAQVSRRHLSIEATATQLKLQDLSSTNGTSVNGLKIAECWLAGGETIRVGQTTLLVEAAAGMAVAELTKATNFGRVVGASVAMRRLYEPLLRLANADVPVVIEGETGTGKELVAETLHELGSRKQGPFVVLDCAALDARTDAVLFGEEASAGPRAGLFEQAQGGTLLVDEIGDLDPALQAKLVRTLEKGDFMRVGGTTSNRADVRVIASTKRNLDREVQEGRFRQDLFFRLSIGRIALPPLRQRAGDIPLLASYFWRRLGSSDGGVPATTLAQWEDYEWPGNVRELSNAVARRIALGASEDAELIESVRASRPERAGELVERVLELDLALPQARELIVEDFERRYVERVLQKHGGNVTRAAASSGIARRYFQVLRARHRNEP